MPNFQDGKVLTEGDEIYYKVRDTVHDIIADNAIRRTT